MEKNNDLGLLPMAGKRLWILISAFRLNNHKCPMTTREHVTSWARIWRDVMSYPCASTRTRIPAMRACRWNRKNVAPYKLQLNPALFAGLMRYIENGKPFECDPVPMDAIQTDDETYKTDMLRLFVNANKTIQWTPLFRERNGKLSGTHIAKYGKVFVLCGMHRWIAWLASWEEASYLKMNGKGDFLQSLSPLSTTI